MIFIPSAEQRHAIEYGRTRESIFSTTGPAGSGKTVLLEEMHSGMVQQGLRVAVCAPTGKAAKNITERTGILGVTAHRLLEFPLPEEIAAAEKNGKPTKISREPKRNRFNPLEYDAIFVDEYSMIPWKLHEYLVDAMPDDAFLRPFGDIQQLKPVEPKENQNRESPFEYMLRTCPSIHLGKIWRNGDDIISNGIRILKGQRPISNDHFFLIEENDPLKALEEWVDAHKDIGINYLSDPDCQIITPSNKTPIGVLELNLHFMRKLYQKERSGWFHPPRHRWDKESGVMFRVGIKVVQAKNDYDTGVMNGETGTIIERTPDGDLLIDFGDRVVKYLYERTYLTPEGFERSVYPQADLDLGIVLSTHKMQGGSAKHIIYVMGYEARYAQGRSNLYTGITRTVETCAVITDNHALMNSLSRE